MDRPQGLTSPKLRPWLPIALIAAVAIVSLPDNSATRVYIWPWFPLAELICLVPILYFATRRVCGAKTKMLAHPLSVGLAIFALFGFVSAVHSEYRCLSIPFFAPYLFLVGTYFSLLIWLEDKRAARTSKLFFLGRALGLLIVLVILMSFAQWWLTDLIPTLKGGISLKATFRNGHPFGHSNYTAGFTVLAFPWLVALAWRTRRLERFVWSVMVVLAVALIASTGSRGGVVGLLVALACFGGVIFWKAEISGRARLSILFCLIIVGFAVAWHEPRLRGLFINRHWDHTASESNRQREGMAEAGWLIGRAHPLFGVGPAVVPYIYPRFRAQLSGGVEDVLQVHNAYLEIWAEMGVAGVVSMALLGFGLLRVALTLSHELKMVALREDLIFPVASFIGVAAYGTFAFTDHQLDILAITLVLSVYFVFLQTSTLHREHLDLANRKAWRWAESAVWLFIALAIIVFAWPNARARQLFSSALSSWDAHDQNGFIRLGHEAAKTAPWDTAYLNEIAGLLSENKPEPRSPTEAFLNDEIKTSFEQSLRQDPNQEYPHFSLGWMALKAGDPSAWAHFHAAAELVPDKGGVYLGEALALLNDNRISEVADALALEALNDPSFLTSPWWRLPDFKGLENETRGKLGAAYARLQKDHPEISPALQYNEQLSDWLLGMAAKPGLATPDPIKREYFSAHRSPANILAADSIMYRNRRTGLPVLVRHADFPAPYDIYEVRQNKLVYRDLKFLFPAKGWLPTFELAALAQSAKTSNHAGTQK